MFSLLNYLSTVSNNKTYYMDVTEILANVSNYFEGNDTSINIYDMFSRNTPLNSEYDNTIITTIVGNLDHIYTALSDDSLSITEVNLNNKIAELDDKYKSIYSKLIENSKSNNNITYKSLITQDMVVVNNMIYPRIKSTYKRTSNVDLEMYFSLPYIKTEIIDYNYTDQHPTLRGIYYNVSPFTLNSVSAYISYYESIYDYSVTITPKPSEPNEILQITLNDGVVHNISKSTTFKPKVSRIIYKIPFLINPISNVELVSNSYIALFYNNLLDIQVQPRILGKLNSFELKYKPTNKLLNLYSFGVVDQSYVTYDYYNITEYTVNYIDISEYSKFRLSDNLKCIGDCDIIYNGESLLHDRLKFRDLTDNVLTLVVKLNSKDSYISNPSIILSK